MEQGLNRGLRPRPPLIPRLPPRCGSVYVSLGKRRRREGGRRREEEEKGGLPQTQRKRWKREGMESGCADAALWRKTLA